MKRICGVLAVLFLCSLLGGCGFWMDGEYVSVKPHMELTLQDGDEVIEVSTFVQLRNALCDLVDNGAQSGIMSASSFNDGTMHYYVDTAIDYVAKRTPIGAYAVDEISYEIGTNRGVSVIAFDISYRHERSEILRIQKAAGMEDAKALIEDSLNNCDSSVLIHIDNYEVMDFEQVVIDYSYNNPDMVMEIPTVKAAVYPEEGSQRLVELNLTYQTSRDRLRQMQEQVASVFTSAELYVKERVQVRDVYSRLYSFLMERNEYTIQSSITPAYSLLHHGVGDSRAFANVYAAMCRKAGLDCTVIAGTKDGEPWCWNLVRFRGEYFHVDILSGSFQMLRDNELTGYVWDYSAYAKN